MAGTPIEILIKALGAEQVTAALKQVTAEMMTVEQKSKTASTSMDQFGTKARDAVSRLNPEFQKASQSTNQFSGALRSANPSLQTFKQSFDGVSTGAPKLTTALDQTATKTATLTERGRALSGSFQSLMTSSVALTGTAITLFETWDSVSDAELNVAKSRNALEQATIRLHSFEAQRNKLIAEGKTGTEQYAIVEEKLALQHQKVEAATGTLQNAEENLAIIQTHFYKEIIPLTISAGASMFDLFSKGGVGLKALGAAFSGLIPAIRGAATSMNLLKAAPILLPLTLLSGVIVAFTSNLFGFKDAVNSAGKALGDLLPFVRPFLDMIGSVGQWLTQTFNGGAQEAQAFEGDFSGSMEGATTSAQGFQTGVTSAMDGVAQGTTSAMDTAKQAVNSFGETMDQERLNMIKRQESYVSELQKIVDAEQKQLSSQAGLNNARSNPTVGGISGGYRAKPSELSTKVWEEGVKPLKVYTDAVGKLKVEQYDLDDLFTKFNITGTEQQKVYDALNSLGIGRQEGISNETSAAEKKLTVDQATLQSAQEELAVMKGTVGATEEVTAAKQEQILGQQILSESTKKLNEEFNKNVAILNTSGAATTLYNQGVEKLVTDLIASNIELKTSEGYWNAYNEALKLPAVQLNAFNQGVVKQRQALVDSKVAVFESAGAYSELVKQMKTGEPQTIAYTQAVIDQKTALEQSKIEVYALQGTLDTLKAQFDSGQQSIVAYNKGFIEQKTSMIQTAIAVESTQGAIAALTQDIASGFAQQVAWNKGLEEGRLAILQNTVALEEREGAFQAQIEALSEGTLQENAMKEATLEMKEGIVESIVEVIKLESSLKEYNNQLKLGIPQSVAMNKAFQEGEKAVASMQEQLAATVGEYKSLVGHISDTQKIQNLMNVGFQEGTNAGLKWVDTIVKANSEQAGYKKGLLELADNWKIKIPEALYASSEAMEEFIALQLRMPDAIDRGLKKAMEDGKEAIDGLTEAWQKGNNISQNEIEKLLGMNIPDDYRKDLNLSFKFKVNEDEIKKQADDIMALFAFNPPDTKKVADETVSGLRDNLETSFRNGQISQTFHDNMIKVLDAMPDPANHQAFQAWIGQFKLLQEAIAAGNADEVGRIVSQITQGTDAINQSAAAYKELTGAINSTVAAYSQLKPDEGSKLQFGGGVGVGLGAQGQAKGDAGTVVDTSALDGAQVKLDAFKTAVSALPGFITEQVTAANTSFQPLGDPLLNEIPTKVLNFSTTLSGISQFITESVVVPANTALTALGDPFLNEIPQKILQFSQTLAQLPGFVASNVVAPIISNFVGMANAIQSGAFTKIQRDAAVAATAVTNIFRSEAAKLATIFDSAVSNAISAFNRMQSAAASTMSSIVSSANNARSSVQNLANAINSLQSRTITITTINRTVNETVNAASGFGPSVVTHPTRLLVGESGPEYVNVTPLSSAANQNLSPNQRLEMYADPGKSRNNTSPLFEMATGTQFTDQFGNNYNFQSDVNTNSNVQTNTGQNLTSNDINSLPNGVDPFPNAGEDDWVDVNIVAVGGRNVSTTGNALPIYGSGGTGGSSGGGSTGGGSTGGGGTVGGGGTAGGNQNFNYQSNGKFYRYTNGQVETNMSESEIAAAEAQLGYKFPRGTGGTVPSGGTGTPGTGTGTGTGAPNNGEFNFPTNIGGVTFPAGFPFNNVPNPITGQLGGSTGSVSTGGGSGVQQSQHVSQGSIVNQGNNSNIDLMSGTNSRLRIQNGVVVEATGIYAGYKIGDPLPGFGGGVGSGPFAGSGSILEPIRGRYRSGQDNQFGIFDNGPAAGMYDVGTPCRLDDILDGGAGSGGGLNGLTDILQLFLNLLKNFTMPFNINTFLDGNVVYKNSVKRYMGNLATFIN